METVRGKHTHRMDAEALSARALRYEDVHIDIGTGDGRYVLHTSHRRPWSLMIGIDACRENLRDTSRRAPDNALFVIANALELPHGLDELAVHVTVNFPWGSLLAGLLDRHEGLLAGLCRIALPGASLEVRLNAGALMEAGWQPAAGARRVREILLDCGYAVQPVLSLDGRALQAYPSTWAKRLAYGRAPHAFLVSGTRREAISMEVERATDSDLLRMATG